MPTSPIVARWELALRLRQRREELGLSPASITKKLGLSPAYLSHIENERNLMSEDKLRPLLDVLDIDMSEQEELLALHAIAKGRGWWNRYTATFGTELIRLFGLEYGAHTIRVFESVAIPGLLQCPEYVRALMNSPFGVRSPVQADQQAEARLRRQERLTSSEPLHFTAILNQAALLQQPWGPDIRRAQLRHLIALSKEHPDTIDIRVLPFDSPACLSLGGSSIYLIDFTSPRLPTLAWSENGARGQIIEDAMQVRELNHLYTSVFAVAPSRAESLALIERVEGQIGSNT
ncbi:MULTISPECIES: helix-turn-helix transcriptional regulator [unclassified Nocardia]|uniref:helix-turn-helix domain-containing protein n=1 Tax=unclassified Nocardia TaxID=2637762 RepID=UPI001CE3CD4B|nr:MULTISPECIES: helix-turn-helix transcriptional regulator [unclassified Nocardia]